MPALLGYAVPFLLVFYLALESGGYEVVTRSQVGILAWWGVLLGVAAGLLPVLRLTRNGWIVLGLLGALTVWTMLALFWTESTERTVIEVSRIVTLCGFLLFLLLVQGKDGLRRSVAALGVAAALIAVVALASRYQPDWFSTGNLPDNYPKARLNYPIGYWNALAALLAMGSVSITWIASHGRSHIGRSLASGALSLMVLAMYMTASRGGLVELAAAVAVLLVFSPGRLRILISMALPALGTAVLVFLLSRRPELRDNVIEYFGSQGTEMMWLTTAVFALVAGTSFTLLRFFEGRAELPKVSRRATTKVGVVAGAVVGVVLIGLVASGFAVDRFNDFKRPVGPETATVDRLGSVNSGERYDQWVSAIDAGKTEPVTGIGPGSYEFWWSREGNDTSFVRDAHSLYLEGFAEMGIPGLLLTLSLVLVPIGLALRAGIRPVDDDRQPLFVAAAAGMTAFAVAAGIDWAWETTVLVAAFLVLVAAIAGPDAEIRRGRLHRRDFRLKMAPVQRLSVAIAAGIAILVVAVPMYGTQLVESSQSSYRDGDLAGALTKAERAQRVNPWAGSADIQVALLRIEADDPEGALDAADQATRDDPSNWRTWLVLSRAAEFAGESEVADHAQQRASDLNRRYAVE